MRYRIRHTTTYQYLEPVAVSHNVVHLAPRDSATQRCLRHELTVSPGPAVSHERRDYFGNRVGSFTVQDHHRELVVRATSEVEMRTLAAPDADATPAWEEVRDRLRVGTTPGGFLPLGPEEFLHDSPLVPTAVELAAYAAPSFTPGRPLLAAAIDLNHRIHADFAYASGATSVTTTLAEVLERRVGVCQDFAQVLIGCMRSLGLPAVYVSGYLETVPPPGVERLVGADASHAWAAVHCPGVAGTHGDGWVHLDPTNDCLPAERHITVAIGRDFSDVSPIKGMILGGGAHRVAVAVDVIPMAGR
ncbi:MAG: transglutaminase family protein [Planctomycetes bacterium]|nr:transglutaminase family protein [Planctomycetota bacterium]